MKAIKGDHWNALDAENDQTWELNERDQKEKRR